MDSNKNNRINPFSGMQRENEIENDDRYSSIDDNLIDNLCEMLASLKEEKKNLGFMEYFFAGYMYAKGFNDVNNIKSKLEDCKLWSHKMKLSFKQKVLMMMLKVNDQDSIKFNKRQTKRYIKQFEESEDVKQTSQQKAAVVVVEESKSQQENSQSQNSIRIEHPHKIKQIIENSHRLDAEDSIDVEQNSASDVPADDPSAANDVIGECKICLDGVNMTELYCLECCAHFLHRDCIRTHLEVSIDSNKIPLMCPIPECKAEIQINSVDNLLDKAYVDRFERFAFKLAVLKNSQKFLSCPTANCDYIFCVEKNDRKDYFKCPSCEIEYCLDCEAPYHDEMSCDEYQRIYGKGVLDFDDQQAIDHALENSMKRCPKCKMWVYRIDGCDYMSCVCGTSFCYNCGLPYENDDEELDEDFLRKNRLYEYCNC